MVRWYCRVWRVWSCSWQQRLRSSRWQRATAAICLSLIAAGTPRDGDKRGASNQVTHNNQQPAHSQHPPPSTHPPQHTPHITPQHIIPGHHTRTPYQDTIPGQYCRTLTTLSPPSARSCVWCSANHEDEQLELPQLDAVMQQEVHELSTKLLRKLNRIEGKVEQVRST